jgi:hypothetical protein
MRIGGVLVAVQPVACLLHIAIIISGKLAIVFTVSKKLQTHGFCYHVTCICTQLVFD